MSSSVDVNEEPTTLFQAGKIIGALKEQLIALYNTSILICHKACFTIFSKNILERREAGLNAAVMARSTLEEFRDTILVPQYLKSPNTNANGIKEAYRAFLTDNVNPRSQDMIQRIRQYPNYFNDDVEQFISHIMEAYSKTSRVIHACSTAFKILHSFDEFLDVITDIPTLSREQETAILLVSFVIPQ